MYNVENMLQPGDCGTTLGWAEVISLQGRYFPKSIFPIVNFPRVYFSTWQLPECANSQAAASKVCPIYSARSPTLFYPQRSAPYPVLPTVLGPLPCSTRSVRSPTLFYPQRSVPYPHLPKALGPLPCSTRSARSPTLFYPQRSVLYPVIPTALGRLPCSTRSAQSPSLFYPQPRPPSPSWPLCSALRYQFGNGTFGKLPLGTLSLGMSPLENACGKIPNTIQRVSINISEYILSR